MVQSPDVQESICETRKGPQPPPIRRGIECFVYAHGLKNHNF